MSSSILAVFISCVALASGQVITVGRCPSSVQPMSNFDAASFLNTWYVQKSYFFIFEFGGKCTTATYTLNDDGSINVANKQINSITKRTQNIEGTAVFTKNNSVGALEVTFPTGPIKASAPYWVLDTDYESYALVWTCSNLGLLHSENAYIMTRERNVSDAVLQKAYAAADSRGINKKLFLTNDQTDCE